MVPQRENKHVKWVFVLESNQQSSMPDLNKRKEVQQGDCAFISKQLCNLTPQNSLLTHNLGSDLHVSFWQNANGIVLICMKSMKKF